VIVAGSPAYFKNLLWKNEKNIFIGALKSIIGFADITNHE
jgi:hypothetical protein